LTEFSNLLNAAKLRQWGNFKKPLYL